MTAIRSESLSSPSPVRCAEEPEVLYPEADAEPESERGVVCAPPEVVCALPDEPPPKVPGGGGDGDGGGGGGNGGGGDGDGGGGDGDGGGGGGEGDGGNRYQQNEPIGMIQLMNGAGLKPTSLGDPIVR